ncbi:MAG: methylmalonyl Co-A mutase-associated GTPase MeaB, partial [Bacteroidetes bacterium]
MSVSKKKKSALSVSEGVEQPGSINLQAVGQRKKTKKRQHSTDQLLEGIRKGDISMLGQAITLVESSLESHQEAAQELMAACLPYSGNAFRVG